MRQHVLERENSMLTARRDKFARRKVEVDAQPVQTFLRDTFFGSIALHCAQLYGPDPHSRRVLSAIPMTGWPRSTRGASGGSRR